tara:strand:+ start:918 stop:1070 length:153 start_codon:yes stop_codon:yes gene_type:complete
MKRKEVKRREAIERNERWAELSSQDQLAHLNRLKLRAKKQRAKIEKSIKK